MVKSCAVEAIRLLLFTSLCDHFSCHLHRFAHRYGCYLHRFVTIAQLDTIIAHRYGCHLHRFVTIDHLLWL